LFYYCLYCPLFSMVLFSCTVLYLIRLAFGLF